MKSIYSADENEPTQHGFSRLALGLATFMAGASGPGRTQDILITARNPGVWSFHCHIANHQASNFSSGFGGMPTVVRIS